MQIQMTNITKQFSNGKRGQISTILNGINLSVESGEMLAIKGPSGAGKSTLMHIIGCLDKPTTGKYILEGVDVSSLSMNKLAAIRNKKIGFVLQNFALVEEDTVLENVYTPLLFSNHSMGIIKQMAVIQLQNLGIIHLAKHRVSTLSGGEKQRVAIARALINNPEIILADEPTGALDTKNSLMVMDILSELNRQGKTVIIVTHESLISDKCKRIVNILDGVLKE